MKAILAILLSLIVGHNLSAQNNTSTKDTIPTNNDSASIKREKRVITFGGIEIIINSKNDTNSVKNRNGVYIKNRKDRKKSNVSTNWFIVDVGRNDVEDKTNYAALNPSYVGPGVTKNSFNLKSNKSINVNVWILMQKLNVIKHVVNLKYGLGFELNNYRYKSNISYREDQTPTVFLNSGATYSKNKLATNYLTVPVLINVNPTPNKKTFQFSVGASMGYLLSSNNKQVNDALGKRKNKGDFELTKFRPSLIGEIGISKFRIYGSYSLKPIHDAGGLKQYPFSIGFRLSSW
jgi:hypothetical protein